jgi:hypothetical protein
MAMSANMVWATMAGVVQTDPQQAQQVWDGLARARAPEVRAMLFNLATLGQRVCADQRGTVRAYPWALTTLLHVHRIVHRLDVLATERPDLRAVIRQVQAAFLQYAGRESLWQQEAPQPSQG